MHLKQHKLPFPISQSRAEKCFDFIHINLWGPYRTHALNGARYFLTVVDYHNRVALNFLLHNKLQVVVTVANFLKMAETQFAKLVKIIRSNNGTKREIVKEQCINMFMTRGILI